MTKRLFRTIRAALDLQNPGAFRVATVLFVAVLILFPLSHVHQPWVSTIFYSLAIACLPAALVATFWFLGD